MQRPFEKLKGLAKDLREKGKAPKLKAKEPRSGAPARAPQDDASLFAEAVSGAVPLSPRSARIEPAARKNAPARPSEDAEVLAQLADLVDGSGPFDFAATDEFIEGLADGVDRRLLARLKGGEYAVQAHLDLHGLTREEAKQRVARFVAESRSASRRCVLLIHGRGKHSKDQVPVLKQAVRSWLQRGSIARSVLAFCSARPADGGLGAVYVLLRR